MTRLATLLLVANFALPHMACADADTVTFGNAPVEVGQVFDTKLKMGGNLTFKVDTDGVGALESTHSVMGMEETQTVTVAAVQGGRATQTHIEVRTSTSHRGTMDKKNHRVEPSSGKAFIATRDAEGVTVKAKDGTIATVGNRPLSSKSLGLGSVENHPDFAGKTYSIGEVVQLTELGSKELLSQSDPDGLSMTATATLTKVIDVDNRKVALFDVAGILSSSDAKMAMEQELRGEMHVDVLRGWPRQMEVSGAVVIDGKTPPDAPDQRAMSGRGRMTMANSMLLRE